MTQQRGAGPRCPLLAAPAQCGVLARLLQPSGKPHPFGQLVAASDRAKPLLPCSWARFLMKFWQLMLLTSPCCTPPQDLALLHWTQDLAPFQNTALGHGPGWSWRQRALNCLCLASSRWLFDYPDMLGAKSWKSITLCLSRTSSSWDLVRVFPIAILLNFHRLGVCSV